MNFEERNGAHLSEEQLARVAGGSGNNAKEKPYEVGTTYVCPNCKATVARVYMLDLDEDLQMKSVPGVLKNEPCPNCGGRYDMKRWPG